MNLQKLSQARSVREFFTELPYELVEDIAAIPLLLFILSPVFHILRNLISLWAYAMTVDTVNLAAGVIGCVAIFLYLGKSYNMYGSIKKMILENITMMFFLVFILLMLLSTAVNGITDYVLHGIRGETLMTYILYFGVYFFCATMIHRPALKELLIRLVLTVSLLLAVLSFVELYVCHLDFMLKGTKSDSLPGIFFNSNHYGYFLTVSIMLAAGCFLYEKRMPLRIFYFLAYFLNVYLLVVNNTLGCYLAVLFGLIFMVIITGIIHGKPDKTAILLLVLFFAISLVMSLFYNTIFSSFMKLYDDVGSIVNQSPDAGDAGSFRWGLWKLTVQCISERPLLGWGMEGIADRLCAATTYERTHNEYLTYTAFFGIPAGLIYIAGILSVYLHGLKFKKHLDGPTVAALIAAFGYCISAFFGNTKYHTAPYFFIILGLAFSIIVNRASENRTSE